MSEDRSHRNGAAATTVAVWPDTIDADRPF